MSNFLRHLLQRTIAPADTLQPRLASRFESGPTAARFTEEVVETGAVAPVAPAPSHPVASAADPAVAPRAKISSLVAPPPPAAVPPPATAPPVIVSVPASPAASPVHPAAHPAPIAPPAQADSISAPPATIAHETFSLPPASASTLLIERVTETIRESLPARGSGSTSSPVPTTSAATASTIAPARPTITRSPAPSAAPAALPDVAPAAPTIRVTIGRVDIRAIHAPPAAPVRTPAPERRPLLSLETYLSQRDAK